MAIRDFLYDIFFEKVTNLCQISRYPTLIRSIVVFYEEWSLKIKCNNAKTNLTK
jgi:hypothetical protein